MGTQLSLPQRGTAPQISAQMDGWIKMPLGREAGLGPSDIVLDGEPAPLPQKGQSPQFSAHVYCGQTAGWIKMPLGMEVDFSPGHIVLDGDPASPLKGAQPPLFGPCLLWKNDWMDQGATWYEGRPWPRPHCVTSAPPPIFGPCLLWPNGRPSQLLLSTCS